MTPKQKQMWVTILLIAITIIIGFVLAMIFKYWNEPTIPQQIPKEVNNVSAVIL